jgi:hypothetical protein
MSAVRRTGSQSKHLLFISLLAHQLIGYLIKFFDILEKSKKLLDEESTVLSITFNYYHHLVMVVLSEVVG